MIRVINYFETQVRVPSVDDTMEPKHNYRPLRHDRTPPPVNGIKELDLDVPQPTAAVLKKMTDLQKASWYGKILESVRLRYRKLQRFARYENTFY
jgi:mitogen-activated protein kinase kinase kinase